MATAPELVPTSAIPIIINVIESKNLFLGLPYQILLITVSPLDFCIDTGLGITATLLKQVTQIYFAGIRLSSEFGSHRESRGSAIKRSDITFRQRQLAYTATRSQKIT
jgi:hypothetical protein